MRILVVTYELPPLGGGGGRAALDIGQELVRRGHEVHFITSHYKGLPLQEEQQGVQVLRIPAARRMPYKAGFETMLGFVLSGMWRGPRTLRAWRPEVIHVHFAVPSGPVAWWLSRQSGIPYVLTAHLGDVPGGVPDKTGRWFRLVYPFTPPIWRSAARVVAVSNYTRRLALQHYPVDIQVIPNGVDLTSLDPGPIRAGQPARILFAGRFVTQKNPLQIVSSLAAIKDLPWECILAGDGPYRAEMEQHIHAAGLQERIQLPGWVTPEQVIELMRLSDILFMPSLTEGLPVVGVQALAMGLAIVASPSGGFIDLVDDGSNGYLIEVSQPGGYEHALRQLLTDPARLLAYRQASRRKAQAFDLQSVVTAYETLFADVIGRTHAAY